MVVMGIVHGTPTDMKKVNLSVSVYRKIKFVILTIQKNRKKLLYVWVLNGFYKGLKNNGWIFAHVFHVFSKNIIIY